MRFGEFDQKVWFAILKLSYKASEWSEAKELVSLYDYHALYYRATESVKALINPSGIVLRLCVAQQDIACACYL